MRTKEIHANMILQKNSIKRGDWLLNDPHRAGRLIANSPLFMLLLIINKNFKASTKWDHSIKNKFVYHTSISRQHNWYN